MAGDKKLTQRDEALVRILDRLSDDVQKQSTTLEEITRIQNVLSESVERSEKRQSEISADTERADRRNNMRLDGTDAAIEKAHESVLRFRSDMLSLVNEQDRLNTVATELNKKNTSIALAQDNMVNLLAAMSKQQEEYGKLIHEINTHSIHHEEILPREIAEMSRSVSKLHMDTEKRLGEMHKETQRQLERIRIDVERRLLALDKIEAALEVLLVRTEPPEKKPFFIVRIFRWLRMKRKEKRMK